jgi:hypothetical protein
MVDGVYAHLQAVLALLLAKEMRKSSTVDRGSVEGIGFTFFLRFSLFGAKGVLRVQSRLRIHKWKLGFSSAGIYCVVNVADDLASDVRCFITRLRGHRKSV